MTITQRYVPRQDDVLLDVILRGPNQRVERPYAMEIISAHSGLGPDYTLTPIATRRVFWAPSHTTWQFLYTTTFLKLRGKGFLNYTVLVYGSKPPLFFEQAGALTQLNPSM